MDKSKALELLDKVKSLIPQGLYCYDENGVCPFWVKVTNKPSQEDGYCQYLGVGDWEMGQGHGLLWDQCKECGINENFERE